MSPDFTGQDDKGAEDNVSLRVSTGLLAPD